MGGTYILAHDIGTTGDKATLFNLDGHLVASTLKEYGLNQPKPTWAEQDPENWWAAFIASTREILKTSKVHSSEIEAISFSGQMMGCLPIDKSGDPLRPSIIWMDQRSIEQANFIAERIGEEAFYRITGNRVNPSYTISKILWLKENEPEVYERAYKFLQSKDYIILKLTGEYVTDYSDASLAGLLDVNKRQWAYGILEELQIPIDKLPRLCASTEVVGGIERSAAEKTGLKPGTPVVLGGGDGACAAVGAGVVRYGHAYNYIGASSWISICADKPLIDPRMRIFNQWHLDPNRVSPTGTMQMAGGSYRWLRDEVCRAEVEEAQRLGVDPYTVMDLEAEKVRAGSEKVIFLPYLMGERSPWWNPNARGVFFGLALGHRRRHLIRAVLEGVCFNLRIILEAFEEQEVRVENIRVIGGGAKSRLWRDIMASVYGKTILVPEYLMEATSFGAAIAAGVGVGIYKDFNVAEKLVRINAIHDPDPMLFEKYSILYGYFKKLYLTLAPLYRELASLEI
ncbi:xylulokinase [Candidatus Bathyarchaeota archaeon]|nr:xylulokinase [Candidatus Bathyarchaeota archaeon]MBS7617099.1 xylulokinase [Candidatus Bathyarchaeota archaeon]